MPTDEQIDTPSRLSRFKATIIGIAAVLVAVVSITDAGTKLNNFVATIAPGIARWLPMDAHENFSRDIRTILTTGFLDPNFIAKVFGEAIAINQTKKYDRTFEERSFSSAYGDLYINKLDNRMDQYVFKPQILFKSIREELSSHSLPELTDLAYLKLKFETKPIIIFGSPDGYAVIVITHISMLNSDDTSVHYLLDQSAKCTIGLFDVEIAKKFDEIKCNNANPKAKFVLLSRIGYVDKPHPDFGGDKKEYENEALKESIALVWRSTQMNGNINKGFPVH